MNFSICENKVADQLCSYCTADLRLCFRCTDSAIPPLLKCKISSFWPSSVTVQAALCWTWSETNIAGFLMRRLILSCTSLTVIIHSDVTEINLCVRKPTIWLPTRSDTNRPVQSQKQARFLKFRI